MKTIFLEFEHENGSVAANGTDSIFFIDGRWNQDTIENNIYEKVHELRTGPSKGRYLKLKFIGYVFAGSSYKEKVIKMVDHCPPEWAEKSARKKRDEMLVKPSPKPFLKKFMRPKKNFMSVSDISKATGVYDIDELRAEMESVGVYSAGDSNTIEPICGESLIAHIKRKEQ